MKSQIINDVHIEFEKEFSKVYDYRWPLPETDADVIVIAGDFWYQNYGLQQAAYLAENHGKPVVMVFGNHDYWTVSKKTRKKVATVIRESQAFARAQQTNGVPLYFLEDESVVIGDVRFLGCSLFVDFNKADFSVMQNCLRGINDFRMIAGHPAPQEF